MVSQLQIDDAAVDRLHRTWLFDEFYSATS
jgi:ABC-type uncharacterized transport system substrate-binding protein